MKAKLTNIHIHNGSRNSPWLCPVAILCKNLFKMRVVVGGVGDKNGVIKLKNGEKFKMSRQLTKAINNYDNTGKMKPVTIYFKRGIQVAYVK